VAMHQRQFCQRVRHELATFRELQPAAFEHLGLCQSHQPWQPRVSVSICTFVPVTQVNFGFTWHVLHHQHVIAREIPHYLQTSAYVSIRQHTSAYVIAREIAHYLRKLDAAAAGEQAARPQRQYVCICPVKYQ
jgi:hypothetical protein